MLLSRQAANRRGNRQLVTSQPVPLTQYQNVV